MRSSIRTRLLVSFLAVALVAAGGLSLYFLQELEAYGLRRMEARLDTEVQLVASMVSAMALRGPGSATITGEEAARVHEALMDAGPRVTTRLRVLDRRGHSVADSVGPRGEDYAERPEVRSALDGRYGAYTRVTPDGRVALYVARPILARDAATDAGVTDAADAAGAGDREVVGVAYASASTFSIRTLLSDYRTRLGWVMLAFIAATIVITELLSRWLSRPLRELEAGVSAVAAGAYDTRVAPRGARETRAVADAFNQMADQVERALEDLREEQRRQARFVSDVSHELRTPLTAIRGTAETLLRGDVPEEEARRFLETIAAESERLGRLAEDLLVLQRIEGGTGELPFSRLDLRRIADSAVRGLASLADERDVRITVDGPTVHVLGNKDRLQQVIGNLLDNAVRLSPAGAEVHVLVTRDGKVARVLVEDQGPGLDPETVPRLFERFYRPELSRDRGTGGSGLGLAIVKAIVEAHGGAIDAENLPEGGSRFVVELPALEA